MAYTNLANALKGILRIGGVIIGDPAGAGAGNVTVKRLTSGSFVANTSSVGQSAIESATFTLTGATTGDLVFVRASTALDAGLSLNAMGTVTATSTVTVYFSNETSAAVVQTSGLSNTYFFVDIT